MKILFKHIDGNRFKLTESVDDYRISKKEEANAFNFMIRKIVPLALEEKYYHFIKKYPTHYPERKFPRITDKDIIRNLRKLRTDIDSVSYESVINDDLDFQFLLKKMDKEFTDGGEKIVAPALIIGVQSSLKPDWTYYDVEFK